MLRLPHDGERALAIVDHDVISSFSVDEEVIVIAGDNVLIALVQDS